MIRDRGPRKNIAGRTFGKLTVLEWVGNSRWACLCACGNRTNVITANLIRGNTSSCGCIKRVRASRRATKHGLYGSQVYRSWQNIRRRCLEKNYPSYPAYGGAGIELFGPWISDPVAFAEYMGPAPSPEHSIDRIDNSKGYMPGNVRWADPFEQANNRKNNRWVTFQGKRYTLAQLARYVASECGIAPTQFLDAMSALKK